MGVEPSDKPQKGESDKEQEPTDEETEGEGDQESTVPPPPEAENDATKPGQGSGTTQLDEEIYVEGYGMTTISKLIADNTLKELALEEFNKMYTRGDLTAEQYKAIESYYAQLGIDTNN